MTNLLVEPSSAEIALQHDLTCYAFTTACYGSHHTDVDSYIEFRVTRALFKGIDFSDEWSPHWDAWNVWRKTFNL